MGPLVPDLIGNELNYVVALVIGIFFGVILEQAGFSTSKKLVGLFYGYDFTVLRVFFTAGVVAMIGVMALVHFGMLDINLIYINPTFIWSAIVGGLIMGIGFVVGGFCPGTSVCAAAIGKVDAILFVAGSFLGVFVFAEGYPLLENLYKAESWGYVRIFDTVGLPQSVFAFLLTAVALTAFWTVSNIEDKVNGIKPKVIKLSPYYIGLASIGIVIAFSAFILPERKDFLLQKVEDKNYVESFQMKVMTVDELAFRLIDNESKLQIIDFRSEEEYKSFNLPKSFSFTIDNLFEKEAGNILSTKGKINVIVAEDELNARKAAVVAKELGFENISVLEGGLAEFKKQIIDFDEIKSANNIISEDTFRFRTKASQVIPVLIQQNTGKEPVKKAAKRIIGGC